MFSISECTISGPGAMSDFHDCILVYECIINVSDKNFLVFCRLPFQIPVFLLTCVCNSVFSPDIDECTQSASILCTFRCVNVPGSYQCACPEQGYTMAANGRTCRGNEEFRN